MALSTRSWLQRGSTGRNGKEEQMDKNKDGKREKKRAPFKGRCYKCNEEGHMAAKCPNKKKDATPAAAANVAEGDGKGVALTVARSAAKLLADDTDLWFLDSGCSQHITGHKEWFTVIRDPSATKSVKGFDGSMQEVAGVASNGTMAAAACNGTVAAAACTGTTAAAACNGTAAGAACNGTVAAVACNGMTKAVADGAASLKTYAQNPPPPRTVIVVPVPSVQGGGQPLDRSVGPLGSKAPTAPPPLDPPSVADSAPVGPEDGPLEVGTSMADHEEGEGEVAVDEQSPMAHEHEPSPAIPPIQPIPPPPRRSSRPNKGVSPVRFQPSAMTALDADDEDNPYDVAYLAEDDCDTDSDDEVEYPDEDEEEEGA
ncbi:unnamed protein product [Closterium sp. Naga37s-1]|nr:unnamed protein product [Closterium sp. Naga37s-1]